MRNSLLSHVRVKPMGFTAFLALFIAALPASGAENQSLLKNSNFEEKTSVGLPLHWSPRAKDLTKIQVIPTDKGNAVKMSAQPGERMFLIQWSVPLTPGKRYQVSYEVKSDKKSEHRVYCEWRNEFKKLTCNDGSWSQTTDQWQEQNFSFLYPAKASGLYLVINPDKGGELEIRNINVRESTDANILKNADFLIRNGKGKIKNWSHLGFKGSSISAADKVLTLNTAPGGGACVVAQWDIAIEPGKAYKVSAEVRAKTPGAFRTYCEWRIPDPANPKAKGRLSSYGGWWRSVGTEWKKDSIVVNFPENCRGAYLVLAGRTSAQIEFRNVKVEEQVSNIPKEAAVAGGKWKLSEDAKFTVENGKAILTIAPKNAKKATVDLTGIKVEPGKRYAFVYTIQGKGAAGSDTGFHPFRISVTFPGVRNDGAAWDDTQNGVRTKSVEFTVPAKLAKKTATISIETTTRGAIALRDFAIKELPPLQAALLSVKLSSPFYRNTLYAGSGEKSITGTVTAKTSEAAVQLFDCKKQPVATQKIALKNGKGTFSIPADKLPEGSYTLQLSAKVGTKDVSVSQEIIKLPKRKVQVEFNGKNFIVNRKVFYPVISWSIAGTSADRSDADIARGFYHAAKNGLNSMIFRVHSSEKALRYLNIADKYGMKIFFAVGNPPSANANTVALWEHQIYSKLSQEVLDHPALLGYFLVDEPYWRGIPSNGLIAAYNILKKIDPARPVWINAAPRGTVEVHKEYSKAADIYGVDVYPIPQPSSHSGLDDKGMTSVGKYVYRMNEACGDNKPIIMALQGFAWGVYSKKNAVYPTFDELRFMTYDSITAGATGVSYWGTQDVQEKKFYTGVLYPVARELRQISGILCCETPAKIAYDRNILRVTAKEYKGKVYMIAINLTPNTVTAAITTTGKNFTVVNEKRNISAVNGKLTDRFAPYAVHIYAEGALPPPVVLTPAVNTEFEEKGNTVFEFMEEKLSRIPYPGKANWIWADGFATPFAKVRLAREFTVSGKVKSARLIISADDVYQVWINGKPADKDFPKSGTWEIADVLDVTALLNEVATPSPFSAKMAALSPAELSPTCRSAAPTAKLSI